MDVLLDLWGVLTDARRMEPAYRMWLARTLATRYGGNEDVWARARDEALAWYEDHLARLETWEHGSWIEVVDRSDAECLVRMFREARTAPPKDPLALARALEFEGMASVDASFPDARTAVDRLRRAGHRVFVSTNATESNARGSLTGARLHDTVDGVFTGELLNAGKRDPRYWVAAQEMLGSEPRTVVVVDDRVEYLAAASACGFHLLWMDRQGAQTAMALPPHVRATLRHLAGLPHLVDLLAGDGAA